MATKSHILRLKCTLFYFRCLSFRPSVRPSLRWSSTRTVVFPEYCMDQCMAIKLGKFWLVWWPVIKHAQDIFSHVPTSRTNCQRCPCSDSIHVNAPQKLSFYYLLIIIIINAVLVYKKLLYDKINLFVDVFVLCYDCVRLRVAIYTGWPKK